MIDGKSATSHQVWDFLSAYHITKKMGDRPVSGSLFKKVAENTGIFITVGTRKFRFS